jgi:hypothetical protein
VIHYLLVVSHTSYSTVFVWHTIIHVLVHSIVCDAPVCAFVKCIKSHSGYSTCENCTEKDEWYGKVVFTNMNATHRTDDQFVQKSDEDHHM